MFPGDAVFDGGGLVMMIKVSVLISLVYDRYDRCVDVDG